MLSTEEGAICMATYVGKHDRRYGRYDPGPSVHRMEEGTAQLKGLENGNGKLQ